MASSLFADYSVVNLFSNALLGAQVIITISCITLLAYAEVANPAYGKTAEVVQGLRRSWMPILAFMLVLFAVTVVSKVLVFVK